MRNLIILISICLISLNNSLYSQSTSELQNWALTQTEKVSVEDVSTFVKSSGSGGEITFGDPYLYSSTHTSASTVTRLSESKFAFAFTEWYPRKRYAIIGTINDTAISFGPKILFIDRSPIAICTLDSNTVLFTTYSTNGNSVIIGEVFGDSISFGSESFFSDISASYHNITSLDNENFIIEYVINKTYFDNYIYVKKGKLVGDFIHLGNQVLVDEGHITKASTIALDSTSFVVTYTCGGGKARPGKISGDSIILGPITPFNSGWNIWDMSATALCDTSFIISYQYWQFCGLAIVGMVNDNAINFGTPVAFDSTRIINLYATTMDNNHFVVSYTDEEDPWCHEGTTILGSVSGYDITFGEEYTSSYVSFRSPSPIAALDPNHFVILNYNSFNNWTDYSVKLGTIEPYPIETKGGTEIFCGGNETLPIFVDYVNQIRQFSLFMKYDTSIFTYQTYQNLNSKLIEDSLSITDNDGIINIQYSSASPINISSDVLLEILFDAETGQNGDVYNFTWNDTLSLYINNFGDTISSHFTNGSMNAIEPIGINGSVSGVDSICSGNGNEEYTITQIENCLSYTWNLEPDNVGLIESKDTIATIEYLLGIDSNLLLYVFGTNLCGNSDTSFLNINVTVPPTSLAGSDTIICENSSCTLSGVGNNYEYVYWSTMGDGIYEDPFLLNSKYTPGPEDVINGSVRLIMYAVAKSPCLGEVGDTLNLTISPLPEVYAGNNNTLCAGNSYLLSAAGDNYSTIIWSTSGDGSFEDSNQLSTYYYPGSDDIELGNVNLILTATSNYPCEEFISDSIELSIIDISNKPNPPQGPDIIILDSCLITEYFIDTVEFAESYQWYLDPPDAGSITGNTTVASVNWSNSFTGLVAYIYVEAINNCGEVSSDSLIVGISPVGILNDNLDSEISILPNPSSNVFNFTIRGQNGFARLFVSNLSGKFIRNKNLKIEDDAFTFSLDLSEQPSGLYYVRIVFENQKYIDRILILRKG